MPFPAPAPPCSQLPECDTPNALWHPSSSLLSAQHALNSGTLLQQAQPEQKTRRQMHPPALLPTCTASRSPYSSCSLLAMTTGGEAAARLSRLPRLLRLTSMILRKELAGRASWQAQRQQEVRDDRT